MKYIKQIAIIIGLTFLSECLNVILPLPVPAGVYGLFILLLCLQFKVIRLDAVEETGNFLLEIMPMLFIPATVSLMTIFNEIKSQLLSLVLMVLLSTVLVIGVTGRVAQRMINRQEKKGDKQR